MIEHKNKIKFLTLTFLLLLSTLAFSQNSDAVVIQASTLTLTDQLGWILKNVESVTGDKFDILEKFSQGPIIEDGLFFASYRISGQSNQINPQSGEFNSRKFLSVSLYRYPYQAFSEYEWHVTQYIKGIKYDTFQDGSIVKYKSKDSKDSELVRTATVTKEERFNFILKEVEFVTGKVFDTLLEPVDNSSGAKPGGTRQYYMGSEFPNSKPSRTNLPSDILFAGFAGYPLYPSYEWSLVHTEGANYIITHADGTVTSQTSIPYLP